MILLPLRPNLEPILQVAGAMREADRREILATRWDDDLAAVARECALFSRFGQVCADDEGKPISALGAAETWPGVWSVWMYATDAWPRIALSVTRYAKRILIPTIRETGAHRAECRSIAGHETAHRWLRRLGAKLESVQPGYGRGGETFLTFAWRRA